MESAGNARLMTDGLVKTLSEHSAGNHRVLMGMAALVIDIGRVTVAPLGLILGIMFKLGRDDETRALGGAMMKISIVVIGLVVLSVVWKL